MYLVRCKDQAEVSLEARYSPSEVGSKMSEAMLGLIRRLKASDLPLRAWGLTSHHRLNLLAEDTYESFWYVDFVALSKHEYRVSYRLPECYSPWGTLTRRTDNEDSAVKMILEAMELSGGWSTPQIRQVSNLPLDAAGPPMSIRPWPVACRNPEIIEALRTIPYPVPIDLTVDDWGVVTLTQGGPTFVRIGYDEIWCWAPPEEVPWPECQYESHFLDQEHALKLIGVAMQKWPRC
jgi:hypothetical protein